jgi:hypothetical protein
MTTRILYFSKIFNTASVYDVSVDTISEVCFAAINLLQVSRN